MKRVFDAAFAILALLLLSPLLVAVALAIALESGRPVFFPQQRVGRGTKTFAMYKFRSMVQNADRMGPYFTSDNDPRITRLGRFIRRTSIDELPQLLNVVIGDMSLVGPRPDVPAQECLYREADWQRRHTVRPGITGLAQANLRSLASAEQRLELDLRYVAEQSFWLDLKIIWMTLARLSGRGSN